MLPPRASHTARAAAAAAAWWLCEVVVVVVVILTVPVRVAAAGTRGGPAGGSGRGFGRGAVGEYKCYQVCPPIVYPNGHDPYYDTPYYQYEKELHGGPFGPGTLNPFSPNDPKNFAGHWPGVKRPVPTRSLPQSFPDNYYPGQGARFLQLGASASAYAQVRHRLGQHAGAHAGLRVSALAQVHPKGVMCLHVCPKTPAARPDDEPFGGPFGPDPYYFRGKTMFNNKNGHTGFGSSASRTRNYQNEPYGGPFGPDPYYVRSFFCVGVMLSRIAWTFVNVLLFPAGIP